MKSNVRIVVAAVVLGLALGIGAFTVPRLFDSAEASRPYPLDDQRSVASFAKGVGVDPDAGTFTRTTRPVVVTANPTDALTRFLDARVAGRLDDAWSVVSDRDRRQYPDAVDWEDANGVLPRVTAYTLGSPQTIGERGQVSGDISFVASLDRVGGIVPARATATWVVVRERGNWRVSLSESTTEATFPPDTAAESAARAWVEARQACRTASQWDGPFLGSGERAASEVCGARGDVRLEPVRELVDDESAETFLAAFGGDVFSWARVVPVVAPTQLDLVLAPIGEQWFVIGAIQASPLVSG